MGDILSASIIIFKYNCKQQNNFISYSHLKFVESFLHQPTYYKANVCQAYAMCGVPARRYCPICKDSYILTKTISLDHVQGLIYLHTVNPCPDMGGGWILDAPLPGSFFLRCTYATFLRIEVRYLQ